MFKKEYPSLCLFVLKLSISNKYFLSISDSETLSLLYFVKQTVLICRALKENCNRNLAFLQGCNVSLFCDNRIKIIRLHHINTSKSKHLHPPNYLNPLPFLHRVGLYPCILQAQRTDSTPSCVWFSSSLIENRALTWTS